WKVPLSVRSQGRIPLKMQRTRRDKIWSAIHHLKESAGMHRRTTPQCRDRRRSFIEATISADDSSALSRRKPADPSWTSVVGPSLSVHSGLWQAVRLADYGFTA